MWRHVLVKYCNILDQITDWFTLGKAVTNVELLGGEPQAAVPAASEPPAVAAG